MVCILVRVASRTGAQAASCAWQAIKHQSACALPNFASHAPQAQRCPGTSPSLLSPPSLPHTAPCCTAPRSADAALRRAAIKAHLSVFCSGSVLGARVSQALYSLW